MSVNLMPEHAESLAILKRVWNEATLQVKDIPIALKVNSLLALLQEEANKPEGSKP
jgi:hypothetical protein